MDFSFHMSGTCQEDLETKTKGSAGNHVSILLEPMVRHLRVGGVISIVEPTQFFVDDLDEMADNSFHEQRFTNHPLYQKAHAYARRDLASPIFGFSLDGNLPAKIQEEPKKNRETCLWRSGFEKYASRFGFELKYEPVMYRFKSDWVSTIPGEFNMTLRNLPPEIIQKMTDDTGKLSKFYGEFRKWLKLQDWPQRKR